MNNLDKHTKLAHESNLSIITPEASHNRDPVASMIQLDKQVPKVGSGYRLQRPKERF